MTCQHFTNKDIIIYSMALKWHVNICGSCYCSLPSTAGLSQYQRWERERERERARERERELEREREPEVLWRRMTASDQSMKSSGTRFLLMAISGVNFWCKVDVSSNCRAQTMKTVLGEVFQCWVVKKQVWCLQFLWVFSWSLSDWKNQPSFIQTDETEIYSRTCREHSVLSVMLTTAV